MWCGVRVKDTTAWQHTLQNYKVHQIHKGKFIVQKETGMFAGEKQV